MLKMELLSLGETTANLQQLAGFLDAHNDELSVLEAQHDVCVVGRHRQARDGVLQREGSQGPQSQQLLDGQHALHVTEDEVSAGDHQVRDR